ncbi:protein FAR-RED IMPAIRED RESPONSE 1-like [Macadamia integrifolia]|uniref:protein FAR-RED IMPAIRED RESPONSE 1-like n=1 Tax=Macadamia integrifolia TaxID=60698 RepID=UPI001C5007E6|nr:protein FAR-RED IMPAIRED RESPONSE 1-like [Macadamia integrifolia]
MGKALTEVLPNTWHGLCIWHLMQNGIKHMGYMMKDGSKFLVDLKKCMFHYDDESQLEIAWDKLRSDHQVEENSWLDRIYCLKYKWAKCYMKETLTIGMRSTQLSESINGDMKDYLSSTLNLVQFFKHFERVVVDKRANELKAEFDTRNKLPRNLFINSPVMNQAARVYTPKIFEKLQKQYEWIPACYIKKIIRNGTCYECVVSTFGKEDECTVSCNLKEHMIRCSCRKFETFGILCRHVFKVLDVNDFKYISGAYILRRWTRTARSTIVHDTEGKVVVDDVQLDCSQRYMRICPKLVRIAAITSNSSEGYAYVDNVADEICTHLKILNISFDGQDDERVLVKDTVVNNGLTLKTKNGPKEGGRRKKSWVENQGKKKKKSVKGMTDDSSQEMQQACTPFEIHHSISPFEMQQAHSPFEPDQMNDNQSFSTTLLRKRKTEIEGQVSEAMATSNSRYVEDEFQTSD